MVGGMLKLWLDDQWSRRSHKDWAQGGGEVHVHASGRVEDKGSLVMGVAGDLQPDSSDTFVNALRWHHAARHP